jgi:hypothetical protein
MRSAPATPTSTSAVSNKSWASKEAWPACESICSAATKRTSVESTPGTTALRGSLREESGPFEIETMAESMVAFAEDALALFTDQVLSLPVHRELIEGDTYYHETHYAGLVDVEDEP